MLSPHEVTVQSVTWQCSDTVTLRLALPQDVVSKPGQFVVLQGIVQNKPTRRSYSLASAPHEQELEITVRSQEQGFFSPFLCSLRPGDTLGVLGPYGQFLYPEDDAPIVLLAAGTGITPFISFLRHHAHIHDSREILLIVSSQTPERVLYAKELLLHDARDSVTVIQTITRPAETSFPWEGRTGRITKEFLAGISFPPNARFYVCGPTAMVVAVCDSLLALGIAKESIKTEKFGKITA